jgi:hypothetical protein
MYQSLCNRRAYPVYYCHMWFCPSVRRDTCNNRKMVNLERKFVCEGLGTVKKLLAFYDTPGTSLRSRIRSHMDSFYNLTSYLINSVLILSSHLRLSHYVVCFLYVFPLKVCPHFSFSVAPILFPFKTGVKVD